MTPLESSTAPGPIAKKTISIPAGRLVSGTCVAYNGASMAAKRNASVCEDHTWELKARFRRHAFAWKSQPAITRIRESVVEIKKVAKKDAVLGADGAVLFLERVSPALERVDSSSGSIGTAVNNAIAAVVPLIASARVDPSQNYRNGIAIPVFRPASASSST